MCAFPACLDVNVANEMIAEVVANVHLFDFAVFVLELNEDVFKKVIKVFLHFFFGHIRMRAISRLSGILRIVVEILEKDCLRECWLIVDSGTAIAVSTCADFEVERTVDSVEGTRNKRDN